MASLPSKTAPWNEAEVERFIKLVDEHRSLAEIAHVLGRDSDDLIKKANELTIALPREFETQFFVRNLKEIRL